MSGYEEAKCTILQLNKAGQTDKDIMELYKDWGTSYDKDVNAVGYQGPKITAEELGKCWNKDRHTKKVVDIASGTGLVGEELHKLGFRIIDALDPSEHMLDVAKQKNVYRNFFCEYVTEEPLDIPENSYDGLTMSGALLNGHFKCSAIPELIRLVKPGGYVVMVTRHENLHLLEEYKERFIAKLDELEKDGKWKKVKFEQFDNYYMNLPGVVIVYQIC